MTEPLTETTPEQVVPGRTRWGVVAAILAVPTLVVAGLIALLVAWLFTDDSTDTGLRTTSCTRALAYGGAKTPAGAHDAACELRAGLIPRYEAAFRMPRDGVHQWLAASYPGAPEPRTSQCGGGAVDECLDLDGGDTAAAVVRVEVTYDGPIWSRVRFVAFKE
ncbi:hypothetical protein ACI2L1_27985 [Streptomyces sp. NPDC019531]|uniref:hypothetical protein n=1 Tax=Streptomyces sp. NPDC019531 TaxID=3365062 RepID=UPI00384BDA13